MIRRLAAAGTLVLACCSLMALAPVTPAAAAPGPALPSDKLHFGLASGPDQLFWMTLSHVPWRYRYTYLAGGLYNNPWPSWQDPALPPGQYALDYMNNSRANGYIPVFPYYMLLQSHRAADEATDDYNNLNNSTLMHDYYANFTLLMQKAAQFGQPVIVHVEPDLWGYLQQRAGNGSPASVSASVSSSGNADVAAYPNNVQGFGQALLHLRDLYAPNVVMAVHASMWSSGRDIATDTDAALNAVTEADKTASFLNATGNWDVVFNDVDDHDAGWWEAQGNTSHWWDKTNTRFPNFARYLSWVHELRVRTGKPQVAWQVPVGNQFYLTENNTPGHYQDNVAEYFLGHTADLYSAGLIAVLFGAGNPDQTTPYDTTGDGVTNNGGAPTTDSAGGCVACNTHVSTVADDDGGYLRQFVGAYYKGPAPGPPGGGYSILTSFGGIYSFGSARYYGNLIDHGYPGPAKGLAGMPRGDGYQILTSFGGIYSFGAATNHYYGNLIDHGYPGPAVAVAMTPTGNGYAILTSFGGLYTFGDAAYFGNLLDHGYPGEAVALSYTPSGNGYAILTAGGGLYMFGDATGRYYGNLIDHNFPGPGVSLAYSLSGSGYSILTASGGIYTFGDAQYYGNLIDHGYPGPATALSTTP